MIPHEEIKKKQDRSWTRRLLDIVMNSGSGDDIKDVCETLSCLEDPRVVQPMLQLLVDTAQPYHLRAAASDVLRTHCIARTEDDRRSWWNSGDWLLMRHVVMEARTSEADILTSIISSPFHAFHCEAIHSLEFGFEEPEYQRLSIKALAHPDPNVRKAAAENLLWDEPVEAEDALIKAVSDTNEDVAYAALHALRYFDSQKVFLALHELSLSGPEHMRECFEVATASFLETLGWRLKHLEGDPRNHFIRWLKPLEEFMNAHPQEEEEESVGNPKLPPDKDIRDERLTRASEIIELFDDVDGCWSDKRYGRFNWEAVNSRDRTKLAKYFSQHADQTVREIACDPLGLWDRGDLLERFLADPCTGVRKSAAYNLRRVTPDTAFASSLWNCFADPNCTGARAKETLQSYVVHAPKDGLEDRLADIALTDRRISRVETAISILEDINAYSHMNTLLSLLGRPPLINWQIHCDLVAYCVRQEMSVPHFADLSEVDDLDLQESLAEASPFSRKPILGGGFLAITR